MPNRQSIYRLNRPDFEPWVELRVFPTTAAMARWIKDSTGYVESDRSGIGFCYVRNGGNHLRGDPWLVAIICLSCDHLGVSTVSHEAAHAAMAWLRTVNGYSGRLGSEPQPEIDEPFADTVGWLCSAIYNILYDNNHCQPGRQ